MPYSPSSSSYGSGFRGTLSPWVLRLLVLNTAIFIGTIFIHLFGPDITFWLGLDPSRVLVQPWTVVTYAFTHGLSVIAWLFSSMVLFFFGPRLEERWGGRGFLLYWFTAVIGGAIGALAVAALSPMSLPLVGATVVLDCLLMAWALYWPTEEILLFAIIPLQIRWLFVGVLVISVLGYASMGMVGFLFLAPMAAAMAAAWGLLHSPWAPRGWGEVPTKRAPTRKTQRAVVPWTARKQEAPAQQGTAPRPAATGARTARAEKDLLDDVDRILDKISAQGLTSLTEEERKRLDEVSRRYRTN